MRKSTKKIEEKELKKAKKAEEKAIKKAEEKELKKAKKAEEKAIKKAEEIKDKIEENEIEENKVRKTRKTKEDKVNINEDIKEVKEEIKEPNKVNECKKFDEENDKIKANEIKVDFFFKKRIIWVDKFIDPELSTRTISQLLFLSSESNDKISILIDSSGGSVTCIFSILSIIEMLKKRNVIIETICLGYSASAAAILLSSGTKGHRFALKNSVMLIHEIQCQGFIDFRCSDFLIESAIVEKLDKIGSNILANNCGKTLKEINKLIKGKDVYLDSKEAIKIGLIDNILEELKI